MNSCLAAAKNVTKLFRFTTLVGLFAINAGYLHSSQLSSPASQLERKSITNLAFADFFDIDQGKLIPSEKLLKLKGKRVRLIGFMAKLENPPPGAFYLCEHPIFGDEEGGGTADLPPESVLVLMSSYDNQTVPFLAGALEITGTLEYGRKESPNKQVSFIRVIVDKP